MIRFTLRRLAFIAFVLAALVYAVYLGMELVPNSEIDQPNYNVIQPSKKAWRQTRAFFAGIQQGDWGQIVVAGNALSIRDILAESYKNSLGLMLPALGVAGILGIGLGSRAALRRHIQSPNLMLLFTLLGISVPSFFVALLLQQGAIRYQRQFGSRLVSVGGFGWDFDHMALPVLVLAARPLAYFTRAIFISLREVMEQDYIRTAQSKGLPLWRVVLRHAAPNFAIPALTAIGISMRFLLGSLPIVEYFFGWHGLGLRTLEGINNRQPQLVAAAAFAFGLTFLLINLGLDISYRYIDPRLMTEDDS